ncbi:MAG: helix-turn-helix transcriptional regulator [Clostridia bacterium]|nr:helix-turn-helix transcriptional regulator [Clostridia bacterium]
MKYTYLPYTENFRNQDSFFPACLVPDSRSDIFHLHPHYEFLCCLEQRNQKFICQNKGYLIDYPCIILEKPFTLHNSYLFEGPPIPVTIVYFSESWMKRVSPVTDLEALIGKTSAAVFDISKHLTEFRDLIEVFHRYPYDSPAQQHTLILILETIMELQLKNQFHENANTDQSYIYTVMKDIIEHFDSKKRSEDYAREYYVSTTTLYRDFKNCTGLTFHQFLNLTKINEAKTMLRTGKFSTNEISQILGFADPTYFFPFFRKYTGMSPKEYASSKKKHK